MMPIFFINIAFSDGVTYQLGYYNPYFKTGRQTKYGAMLDKKRKKKRGESEGMKKIGACDEGDKERRNRWKRGEGKTTEKI